VVVCHASAPNERHRSLLVLLLAPTIVSPRKAPKGLSLGWRWWLGRQLYPSCLLGNTGCPNAIEGNGFLYIVTGRAMLVCLLRSVEPRQSVASVEGLCDTTWRLGLALRLTMYVVCTLLIRKEASCWRERGTWLLGCDCVPGWKNDKHVPLLRDPACRYRLIVTGLSTI
jgi:hypothetical protein